ncbi:MAG TPA: hypothetical protein VF867_07390 [Arthrobacter sp.]
MSRRGYGYGYGSRLTFWEWLCDIDWGWLFFNVVMVVGILAVGALTGIASQEAERVAVECAAQPGHEPFRTSQYHVICLDKQDHTAPARTVTR